MLFSKYIFYIHLVVMDSLMNEKINTVIQATMAIML